MAPVLKAHTHTRMQSSPAYPVSIATANKLIKCQSNWFSLQVLNVASVNLCVWTFWKKIKETILKRSERCVRLLAGRNPSMLSSSMYYVCLSEKDTQGTDFPHSIHLVLDIQRTFLFMEEFQGLHMAVPCCIVDSIGSTLKVLKKKKFFLCSVCLFKCAFLFLHDCSLDACFNSWVTKITPHRFTLSPAWISAPFLISTSMIWMLPQPAAIRRGGVPCCNTNNMIKWINDWPGCVPHMYMLLTLLGWLTS